MGGKTEARTVVKAEMAREYDEETMGGKMGILETSPTRLSNAFLFKGLNEKTGCEIFYLFYPLSEEEYTLSGNLNVIRNGLKDGDLKPECLEKDRFFWFNIEGVRQKAAEPDFALTPVGASLLAGDAPVKLRAFFIQDFVTNPLLSSVIKECAEIQSQKVSEDKKAA